MLAKRCGILIHKDITNTTPKVVYEHEIPVLNFKFGAKNIKRTRMERWISVDPKKPNVHRGYKRWPIVEIDHDSEFGRLLMMYGKHEESGDICVERAYGYFDERKLEIQGEFKYRPLINAGHTYIKPEPIPEAEYSDGMTIFDTEDLAKAEGSGQSSVPDETDSDKPTLVDKPYEQPLTDQETMFKIENMTREGIIACLEDRDVEFDEKLSKPDLHTLFMDSMKPVGVDPELPDEE